MPGTLYQYEQPPMPQDWKNLPEREMFYTRLMDVLDDIYQRFGNTDNALAQYKKALAETVEAIETKTAENSQAIEDIIGGDTPVVTKTVTIPCYTSATYRSKTGWASAYDVIQGYEKDSGVNYGCMWFNMPSVLTGKTITEAKLKLVRENAYGANVNAKILLGACTNTARNGTIAVGDLARYGEIGSIGKGKTGTLTLNDVSVVEGLVAGTRKGLVAYAETSQSYYSSYMFSKNYAAFYGSNQNNNAPQLIVTYEE